MIDHHALYIKLKKKMIKSDIKKGDIYYATLNPAIGSEQKGERPVVVLQNDCGNKYSPTVIVAPLTKIIKKEKLPTHILIHNNDFLRYNSLILLEQIRVIDKSRIISYMGSLLDYQLDKVNRALVDVFDFDIISYLKTYGIGENYVQKKKRLYSNYYSE